MVKIIVSFKTRLSKFDIIFSGILKEIDQNVV